jgi:DNA-binding NarL/FixJ family response regulator
MLIFLIRRLIGLKFSKRIGGILMFEYNDITVFVLERDIYARQAIVSYLGWDRRTRAVGQASTLHEMFSSIASEYPQIPPNVVTLDTGLVSSHEELDVCIRLILDRLAETKVICLAPYPDLTMAAAAAKAGACGYLVRSEVGVALASAICFTYKHHFVVTHDVASKLDGEMREWPAHLDILPERRRHPQLTQRLEQALSLCVIEGLPTEIAAGEMGVSTSTVRSYIKEVYRILEAEDDAFYPTSMSPAERAFVRYSALDNRDYYPHSPSPLRSVA